MQPRRVARELALLAVSQLPSTPAKLEEKQLQDFIVAAVRSLSEEVQDILGSAGDEVSKSHRAITESEMHLPLPLGEGEVKTHQPATNREAAGEYRELARLEQVTQKLEQIQQALRTADPSNTSASTLLSELSGLASAAKTATKTATQHLRGFEQRLQSARSTLSTAASATETAINRLGSAVNLPEFERIAAAPDVRTYALKLAIALHENKEDVDQRLQNALVGWNINRLGRVERDILRLAVVEMSILVSVPESIAINEAVELAKTYGGDDTPAFVNGVLRRYFNQSRVAGGDSNSGETDT